MSIFPWVICIDKFYDAKEHLGLDNFQNINNWIARILKREKSQKGLEVCPF
jgi:GST-like protein